MQSFVDDARYRIRDTDDEKAVVLKFLCTQLPHWDLVYPYIADDLESVQFRAPGVLNNYARYKQIEPKVLDELIRPIESPLIDHFAETVNFPLPEKKAYGFFLVGQKNKNLEQHLEHLLPGDEHFAERKRLFKAIQGFDLPSDTNVIEQLADTVRMVSSDILIQDTIEESEPVKVEKEEVINRKITLPDAPAPCDLSDNPSIVQFKQLAGLASHFPTIKVVNQILAKSIHADELVESQLGKFQTEIPNLQVEDLKELVKVYPSEKLQSAIDTPEMEEFYHSLRESDKPKDKLSCVQMFLSEPIIKKLIV